MLIAQWLPLQSESVNPWRVKLKSWPWSQTSVQWPLGLLVHTAQIDHRAPWPIIHLPPMYWSLGHHKQDPSRTAKVRFLIKRSVNVVLSTCQTCNYGTSSIFKQRQGLSFAYGKVRGTKNWAAIKTKNKLFCLYNLHYNIQGQNIICKNLNTDAYYLCLISHSTFCETYHNTIHNANMCCIYNTIVAINIHLLLLYASGEANDLFSDNIFWINSIILTSMLILKE